MSDVQFDEQFDIDKTLSVKKETKVIFGSFSKQDFFNGSNLVSDLLYGAMALILFAYSFTLFFSTTIEVFARESTISVEINQAAYAPLNQ